MISANNKTGPMRYIMGAVLALGLVTWLFQDHAREAVSSTGGIVNFLNRGNSNSKSLQSGSQLWRNCLSQNLTERLAQPNCHPEYDVEPRNAYFMLHTNDDYLKWMIVLEMSMRDVRTITKRVCMVDPKVSSMTRSILSGVLGFELLVMEDMSLESYPNFEPRYSRWTDTLYKLQYYNRLDYKRIVTLDSDMLMLHPIDDLFDRRRYSQEFYGTPDPLNVKICTARDNFNAAVQVIEPSAIHFNALMEMLTTGNETYQSVDQTMATQYWNKFYNNTIPMLDEKYMAFYYRCNCEFNEKNAEDYRYTWDMETARVIHFPGDKEKQKKWFRSEFKDSALTRECWSEYVLRLRKLYFAGYKLLSQEQRNYVDTFDT